MIISLRRMAAVATVLLGTLNLMFCPFNAAKADPIPLIINNLGGTDPDKFYQGLSGIVPATLKTTGRFSWNVSTGEVFNPVDELIATVGGGSIDAQMLRVQGVINKWAVLRVLEHDTGHMTMQMRLEPDDVTYRLGARIVLLADGIQHPYFTLFNLASDGAVNFVYPVTDGKRRDSLTIAPGVPFRLPLQVTPPFGADHFIAIASANPLSRLHAELKAIDGKPLPANMSELLESHLTGETYQLGMQGVFSGR
ncbi:MAG: DUF4384 domain-containing protein [Rhodospirillaceae bacterium]